LPASDALAKAKAVLAKQKELAEKLKKLKGASGAEQVNASNQSEVLGVNHSEAVRRALEIAERAKARRREDETADDGQKKKAAGAAAPGGPPSFPKALRLNAKGEEIDADGNVVVQTSRSVPTFKVNAKKSEEAEKNEKLAAFAALQRASALEIADAENAEWMDPRTGAGRRRHRKGGFQVRRSMRNSSLNLL
jgi:U4/U6 small nuclear ribonucleoprotein PRP3